MIFRLILILLAFVLFSESSFSQLELKTRKKLAVEFRLGYESGSSYYTKSGKEKYNFPYNGNDSLTYRTEFSNYLFGVKAKYTPFDQFSFYAELPFAYLTSDETFDENIYTDSIEKGEKGSFGVFQPLYYGFGAQYRILNSGKFIPSVLFDAKVPTIFKNGLQNSLEDSLLRYSSFEFMPGLQFLYQFETSALALTAGYNFRDADLRNQYRIRLDGGFSTVPTTMLRAYLEAVVSTDDFDKAVEVNTKRIGYQEDYYSLGIAFQMAFNKDFYSVVSYNIKLAGKNTWSLGVIGLSAGLLF